MATIGEINAKNSKTGTWTSSSGKVYTSSASSGGSNSSGGSSSSGSSSNTNLYSTVDGHKLSPGETYQNKDGKYVTQGTPLGTTSPTAPKNGVNSINNTLTIGSQGDSVKALQQYLRDTAGQTKLTVDGHFGPETQAAVKLFQSQNGLQADGIVGPLTIAKLKTTANTDATVNNEDPNAIKTGDANLDETLKSIQQTIKDNQDKGLAINPDLVWDQSTLDKFLESAKKQVHPFYSQQIDAIKADVLKAAPQILQNYESDVAGSQADFTKNLGTARENYADTGLAFSGQRTAGELGMQASTNRDLASLSQTYGNKLYDLGRTAEQKIGASATPSLGSLANYSTNLSGNGGFQIGGTTTPYTSGGFQIGSLTNDEAAAIEARNLAIKKAAGEAVVAGRDYSSLFS